MTDDEIKHRAKQKEDGSLSCICPVLEGMPDKPKAKVSVNYLTKTLICSVCGEEVTADNLVLNHLGLIVTTE